MPKNLRMSRYLKKRKIVPLMKTSIGRQRVWPLRHGWWGWTRLASGLMAETGTPAMRTVKERTVRSKAREVTRKVEVRRRRREEGSLEETSCILVVFEGGARWSKITKGLRRRISSASAYLTAFYQD